MFNADTLVTRYVLDDSAYVKGAKKVVDATQSTSKALDNAAKKTKSFQSDMNRGFGQFYDKLKLGFDVASKFIGVMVGIGGAILGASMMAARKAADFEALEKSMIAVEGSAKKAKEEMAALFGLAKGPGLDPEGAVKGFVGLRQAGVDGDMAKFIIEQSGNANAIAGGGRSEFESILRALKQIAAKPFLQGDELLQLTEAGIPANRMVQEAFGTSDTEALKKAGIDSATVLKALAFELEKLPRAGNSAKNEIENFETSLNLAFVGFGKGILDVLGGSIGQMSNALDDLTQSGIFKDLGLMIGDDIMSALGVVQTGDLRGNMIELGAGLVTLSAATRNFFTQIGDLVEFIQNLLPPLARWGIKKLTKQSDMLDPQAEGDKFRKDALSKLAGFDKAKEGKAKEAADKAAETRARIEGERAEHEKKMVDAKGQLGGQTEATNHLKNISANTRKLVDLQNMILGGGAVTEAANNAVNLNRVTRGGGGSDIDNALFNLGEAIKRTMGKNNEGLARHQHLNPRAI